MQLSMEREREREKKRNYFSSPFSFSNDINLYIFFFIAIIFERARNNNIQVSEKEEEKEGWSCRSYSVEAEKERAGKEGKKSRVFSRSTAMLFLPFEHYVIAPPNSRRQSAQPVCERGAMCVTARARQHTRYTYVRTTNWLSRSYART